MFANGIKESTSTTGTGALTISAATGFVRFSQKHTVGSDYLFPYTIIDSSGAPLEGGLGYLSATSTLVRAVVQWTYSAGVYLDIGATALSLTGANSVICSQPWQAIRSSAYFGCQYNHTTAAYKTLTNSASSTYASGINMWSNNNRMHYWPILLEEGGICDGFTFSGVANAASYEIAIGLYTLRSNGLPGSLLASTGKVVPVAASAPQSFPFVSSAVAVMPGVYYIGAVVTSTALTFDLEMNTNLVIGTRRGRSLPNQFLIENITAGWTDVPTSSGAPTIYTQILHHMCVGLKVA